MGTRYPCAPHHPAPPCSVSFEERTLQSSGIRQLQTPSAAASARFWIPTVTPHTTHHRLMFLSSCEGISHIFGFDDINKARAINEARVPSRAYRTMYAEKSIEFIYRTFSPRSWVFRKSQQLQLVSRGVDHSHCTHPPHLAAHAANAPCSTHPPHPPYETTNLLEMCFIAFLFKTSCIVQLQKVETGECGWRAVCYY
jgi:hypothetical protein